MLAAAVTAPVTVRAVTPAGLCFGLPPRGDVPPVRALVHTGPPPAPAPAPAPPPRAPSAQPRAPHQRRQHDGDMDGGRETLPSVDPLPVPVHRRRMSPAGRGADDAQRHVGAGPAPAHQEGGGAEHVPGLQPVQQRDVLAHHHSAAPGYGVL